MPSASRATFLLALATPVISPAAFAATASFTPLGDALSPTYQGGTRALSADGSTVVGTFRDTGQPFRWTAATGFVPLAPAGAGYSAAAVSGDGSVVVGSSSGGAFRWTQADGLQPLNFNLPGGYTASGGTGVSADGSVVVGVAYSATANAVQAFRWTAAAGATGLGVLPGAAQPRSVANAVSADGSVVTGYSYSATGQDAFRWTAAGGMQSLGDLPGSFFPFTSDDLSAGVAASADGSVIVGYGADTAGSGPVRWTAGGGPELLGPTSLYYPFAYAVSADGSIVLGGENSYNDVAFIWDAAHGIRSLSSVLTDDYGLGPALTGWTLNSAYGISADNSVLLGEGINPDGNRETFLVTLPEPAILSPLALGAATLFHRRRVRTLSPV